MQLVLNNLGTVTFTVVGASSSFLVYYALKHYFYRRKYSHIPGPETKGVIEYFLGNYRDILRCLKSDKIISDQYLEWSKKYGSVFKFQLFGEFIVVTNEPDAVKEIIINKNFPKNEKLYSKIGFPFKQRFMGHGLVTECDDQKWKARRSVFNPGFHRNMLMSCLKEFNSKTDILMDKLRTLADGKTQVVLFKEINRMTLDIISSVAFGFSIDTINHPDNEFSNNISESFVAVNKCLTDPIFVANPFEWKKRDYYRKVIQNLRAFAKEKILKRLEKIENNEYAPDDILTAIVKSCKQDELDLEALVDDFITFFNAGQETTANTLAFCFMELGRNPGVFAKLREEVDRVLGAKTELHYDDMTELVYTGCVFKETLRLWPPAPELIRTADEDFYINNYKIPKGTQLNLSPYFCGRNEKFFPNPTDFKPERFLNEDSEVSNYTYFPFSIGPRNCIGRNFALIESKVFIAKFVQNFDFILEPNQSMDAALLTTLRPKDGTKCYLTPRKN